jgi:hypothetical protein
MATIDDACGRCGKPGVALYENAAKPGQMLCFPCLTITNPHQVACYPGWPEREQRHDRRAQVARVNFRLA